MKWDGRTPKRNSDLDRTNDRDSALVLWLDAAFWSILCGVVLYLLYTGKFGL